MAKGVTRRVVPPTSVVLLCAFGFVLFGAPTPARAFILHKYLGPVVKSPTNANIAAMALDPGAGGEPSRLWVAEHNAGVHDFNAVTGAEIAEVKQPSPALDGSVDGVAVGHSTGETQVYVSYSFTATQEVGVFSGSGAFLGRWNGSDTPAKTFGGLVGGVAVDNNSNAITDPAAGRVYVADYGEGVIDVFKPKPHGEEEYVTDISGPRGEAFHSPFNHWDITVDQANGEVFVENVTEGASERHLVDIFEPTALGGYKLVEPSGEITGTPNGTFEDIEYLSLAVEPGAGEAYVAEEDENTVDQFSLSSDELLGRITGAEVAGSSFGHAASLSGVAVDPSTRDVFVGVDRNELEGSYVARFGEGIVLPDVTTSAASPLDVEKGKITESLNGLVNPLEGETHEGAACDFVWGTSESALSQPAKCRSETIKGSSPAPVQAAVDELQPDTTYFYRLTAANAKGTNLGEEEEDHKLEPPHKFTTPGPGLRGESVSKVTSSSATLEAAFDPHGSSTSYYFQYGTESCAASGSSCAASPSAPEGAGSGEGDVQVARHLQGLKPETLYHYRVVVVSDLKLPPEEQAAFYGPEATFTTQGTSEAAGLIDGRAWELVSPALKNGALVVGLGRGEGDVQASSQGGAITYTTRAPTEVQGLQGYSTREQVLSLRGADGWRSCDLGTVQATPEGVASDDPMYPLFSNDLSGAIVQQETFNSTRLSEEASERTPYVEALGACEAEPRFTPLATAKEPFADVTSGLPFGGEATVPAVKLVTASPNLDHVILISTVQLTKTHTPPGQQELYEWSADAPPAERLQLISELPLEELGNADGLHAVSDDGTRVFWPESAGQTFMRDTVAGGKGETIALGGIFQFATGEITGSTRASKAFLTENNQLYECEIAEAAGKVQCNRTSLTPTGAEVLGNVSVSEDG
ncbi:MAG: hypothetical protein FWD42_00690, partial [Solirubrobacterales bacterium]|nr:hypothetical protein [Solirubrobacterales bacterium]